MIIGPSEMHIANIKARLNLDFDMLVLHFNNMMMELHYCKQSTLIHCFIVLGLCIFFLLLYMLNQFGLWSCTISENGP